MTLVQSPSSPRRRTTGGFLFFNALFAITRLLGAEPTPAPVLPLSQAALSPRLLEAAKRDGIALHRIEVTEGNTPRIGDAVVAWVGASDGKTTRQWLVQLRRAALTPAERKIPVRDTVRYLSWGPVVTFKSAQEALEVWIAGPVDAFASQKGDLTAAPTARFRTTVTGDYLRLGLDRSALIDQHFAKIAQQAALDHREISWGNIYSMDKPIKPENIGYAKPAAEQLNLTPEQERVWAGGSVAMGAFYEAANSIPALRRIAEIAADKPPAWKFVKLAFGTNMKGGVGNGRSRPIFPRVIGLMPLDTDCFTLGFSMALGDDPIIGGDMVVTQPTPPLDVGAGILGLLAVHPKDPNRMVHLTLISAERGPAVEGAVAGDK